MKLWRHAKPFAFSKIYSNLIFEKLLYFFIVFVGVDFLIQGLADSIVLSQNIDLVFSTRCEAKCWNKPSADKIPCIRSCLNGSWNKPGSCPSNEKENVPNLTKACTETCESDIECSGMLKCCQHSCGSTTCQDPAQLEKSYGILVPIPTNVKANFNKTDSNVEHVKMIVQWTAARKSTIIEKIFYILEECHHSGKTFYPSKLSAWAFCKQTSRSKVELKHLVRPGRWYRFRVTAINENGTLGASEPSEPIFTSLIPKLPEAPGNLRVGATSWGNSQFNIQLTWNEPLSEVPISKYKITWSMRKNYTLIQHHHTLPWDMTSFWLYNLESNTEYFLQVQAQANYGMKRLLGKETSIVIHTANLTHESRHSHDHTKNDTTIKYKRHIKDFLVEKLYWLHDQLLAHISWKPIKKVESNYSISWSHSSCHTREKTSFTAKTNRTHLDLYGLEPDCRYKISVKTIWRRTLYIVNKKFSTENCKRNNLTVLDNVITICS